MGGGGGGVKTRIYPPYPDARRQRQLKWGEISGNNRKKVGPVSLLGRAH